MLAFGDWPAKLRAELAAARASYPRARPLTHVQTQLQAAANSLKSNSLDDLMTWLGANYPMRGVGWVTQGSFFR